MTTTASITEQFSDAKRTLDQAGQSHVLRYFDELDAAGKSQLLAQIQSVDWPELSRLVESHVKAKPEFALPANLAPAPWYPYEPTSELKAKYAQARAEGERLLREGKVAAFTVAGGQGTRLGWPGPKGTFPATPIRKLPLFACFAEYLHKAQQKWGKAVPWYVMTSPINEADTRAFFEQQNYFGLSRENIMFFSQAMMPAIDMSTGKVLLEANDSLALSPNGHGGSLKALWVSGAIADMIKRGVEQISYTQVDNPIVRMVDPLFIGLHALDGCAMSSKMLPKAFPKEKLGNFCLVDGRVSVIEYSDLPDELAEQRTADGELRFRAGSIALHAIRVDFVRNLSTQPGGFALPFHRADKKVPFMDPTTLTLVKPEKANAVKLETFVFDALPLAEKSIIYEADRFDEFGPIKNADTAPDQPPAVDSPASSTELQIRRAAKWLEAAGVKIARNAAGKVDAIIELKQTTAIYPEDLVGVDLPKSIGPGQRVVV